MWFIQVKEKIIHEIVVMFRNVSVAMDTDTFVLLWLRMYLNLCVAMVTHVC